VIHHDISAPGPLFALIGERRPEEIYNLAGESSVSSSFVDPRTTWESNAHAVVDLLDAVRLRSSGSRFYQASSGEMFGSVPGESVVHDEAAPLNPQSPYAAAKAAAHMVCRSYRESYGIKIACGILFNHESRRRGPRFLSRKVVDHVRELRSGGAAGPLALGNLKVQRDWGFAPDYVDGMVAILRQASLRGDPERADLYRDYLIGTGRLHTVWELVDRAFSLAGFELAWKLEDPSPLRWSASFAGTGDPAIVVDPGLIRPSDPQAIAADPSRIAAELGWEPRPGLDLFLEDMLRDDRGMAASLETEREVRAPPSALLPSRRPLVILGGPGRVARGGDALLGHKSLEEKLRDGGGSAPATVLHRHDGADIALGIDDNLSTGVPRWLDHEGDIQKHSYVVRVEPAGQPSFEAKLSIRENHLRGLMAPRVGDVVTVLFDAGDHDKIALDVEATAAQADTRDERSTLVIREDGGGGNRIIEPPASAPDDVDKLKELAEMHASGALTDAEFAAEKAKLLKE
jgi:GDPmannose 4,6-dehydratase